MYKGKYVLKVEYDFRFDENTPNLLPVDQIRKQFQSEKLRQMIAEEMMESIFDPEMGKCEVSLISFDMKKEE